MLADLRTYFCWDAATEEQDLVHNKVFLEDTASVCWGSGLRPPGKLLGHTVNAHFSAFIVLTYE